LHKETTVSKKKNRRNRNGHRPVPLDQFLGGRYWVFLCFTPDRVERLRVMLAEAVVATNITLELGVADFPPGVLWNGQPCRAFFVRKDQLRPALLVSGLRKHLGYELPDLTNDTFTLGVTAEDDARLDRVGLFGQKRA
jgi:hypothetical protein